MEQLEIELQSIIKDLKALTQKMKRIARRVDRIKKAAAPKKSRVQPKAKAKKRRVAKKTTRPTAFDTVMDIIQRSKEGVNTAQIKAKTIFNEKKIWDIVNRAKKLGKIKSPRKGFYVKK